MQAVFNTADSFQRPAKPAQIYGKDLPGLAALKTAKPSRIKIEYTELPDTAQIHYSTGLPLLINAIH